MTRVRTALITTTVNVPTVLGLYRKLGPDVFFFVAADEKTPREAYEFCAGIPGCEIYSPGRQRELGYEVSSFLGWSTITRRNIALLEALKWGADVIVSIDDDNIPVERYFERFGSGLDFSGCELSAKCGWLDPGHLMVPKTKHRGFPHDFAFESFDVAPVVGARVGVSAGLCLGDPDISAATRMELKPLVQSVTELARGGVVVDPRGCWTVWNTQNTSFVRELAPAMFCAPQIGRCDDIYASLITQRAMRELGYYVHFGRPFVHQQRNPHDLLKDMAAEMWGMSNIVAFANFLDATQLPHKNVLDNLRRIWKAAEAFKMPAGTVETAQAFLSDCEKVM